MQRLRIPVTPDELTPQWLTHVLRRSSVLPENAAVSEVTFGDPGQNASYAGFVIRAELDYDRQDTGAPRAIIAKFPAPERVIRRLFRSMYHNEALFYRHLSADMPVLVPESYAALINRKRTRSLLLLQDLTEFATMGDHDAGCSIEQARIALSRLAGLHAAWWQDPRLGSSGWPGRYRVNSPRNWLIYAGAWVPFQLRLRHVTPPETLRLIRNLWRYRDSLLHLEADRPVSLQHGDFRLANLAFTPEDVYLFDWQVVRSGLPLFDVAWFMLTSLTLDQRRQEEADLIRTYHVGLVGAGVSGYSMDDVVRDYRLALLLTIPQIMVIGGFLRMDSQREDELGRLLRRFDAAREDHDLERLLRE